MSIGIIPGNIFKPISSGPKTLAIYSYILSKNMQRMGSLSDCLTFSSDFNKVSFIVC